MILRFVMDKIVLTYWAPVPPIKWSISTREICWCKGFLNADHELKNVFLCTCCLLTSKQSPLLFGINCCIFSCLCWFGLCQLSKKVTSVSPRGVLKCYNLVSVLIPQSSNSIRLLKLISLVNLCSCAGLEGLIRPGTWRPPGQYPQICMKDLVKSEIRLKSTFVFSLFPSPHFWFLTQMRNGSLAVGRSIVC